MQRNAIETAMGRNLGFSFQISLFEYLEQNNILGSLISYKTFRFSHARRDFPEILISSEIAHTKTAPV